MFVKFVSCSTVARKGFKAFIHKIGKLIQSKISEKFARLKRKLKYCFYLSLQMIIGNIGRT